MTARLGFYAIKTDQGPYLNVNEDGHVLDLANGFFAVIDAYGGPGVGDKCVGQLKEQLQYFYRKVGGDADATMPFYYSPRYLLEGNALINAVHYAHKILWEQNAQAPMSKRAGASVMIGGLAENVLTWVSTGNVACYLYRGGRLQKVITEDSLYYLAEDDFASSFKSTPMSGIGLFADLHYQVREVKVVAGDLFLILTDGVYSRLSLKEIQSAIPLFQTDYMQLIEHFFEKVNTRGNLDNQTGLILQF